MKRLLKILNIAIFACILFVFNAAAIASFISYSNPTGQTGNQGYTGSLGMDFVVNSTIQISALGAFTPVAMGGLVTPITVQLYNTNTGSLLYSQSIDNNLNGSYLIGSSLFYDLPIPLLLGQGAYSIVASGYSNSQNNGNTATFPDPFAPTWSTDGGGGLITFVGNGRFGSANQFPGTVDGAFNHPANAYAAGTFIYDSVATPEPGTMMLMGSGVLGMLGFRRRELLAYFRK